MRVLLLGPERKYLSDFIVNQGDSVESFEDRIGIDMDIVKKSDWLISYGYRYLISPQVLGKFEQRAVNLHISYLPWNRGADPNVWSFLENTPKGVTIHRLAPKFDTGEIVAQKAIDFFNENETLRSSYEILTNEIEALFCSIWGSLRNGLMRSWPQPAGGSFHKSTDKEKYKALLVFGWDTPVRCLIGKAQ